MTEIGLKLIAFLNKEIEDIEKIQCTTQGGKGYAEGTISGYKHAIELIRIYKV